MSAAFFCMAWCHDSRRCQSDFDLVFKTGTTFWYKVYCCTAHVTMSPTAKFQLNPTRISSIGSSATRSAALRASGPAHTFFNMACATSRTRTLATLLMIVLLALEGLGRTATLKIQLVLITIRRTMP